MKHLGRKLVGCLTALGVSVVPLMAMSPAQAVPAPIVPVDSQRGLDPYLSSGNKGYDVENYNVVLRYNKTNHGLGWSQVKVYAKATDEINSASLDVGHGLTVGSVSVDGKAVEFVRTKEKILFRLGKTVAKGQQFVVGVAYHGKPDSHSSMEGTIGHYAGWMPTPTGAVTYSEPNGTHEWMPSNDVFYDKATWNVVLVAPKGLTGLSTGKLVKSTTDVNGYTSSSWKQDQPITSYQQFVTFDTYKVWSGKISGYDAVLAVPVGKNNTGANPSETDLVRLRKKTQTAIDWLTKRLGPLPYSDVGVVVTKVGTESAMETAGRVTCDQSCDNVTIVHEFAHQWFAGRQTATYLKDVWLHEGFATWLDQTFTAETMANMPSVGNYFARPFAIRNSLLNLAGNSWSDKDNPFYTTTIADATRTEWLSSTVYYRGSAALEVLYNKVGATKFWNILKTTGNVPAGQTMDTRQWIAKASIVAGQDLTPWANEQLYSKGLKGFPNPTLANASRELAVPVGVYILGAVKNVSPASATAVLANTKLIQGQVVADAILPWRYHKVSNIRAGKYGKVAVIRMQVSSTSLVLYPNSPTFCLTLRAGAVSPNDAFTIYDAKNYNTSHAPNTIAPDVCPV